MSYNRFAQYYDALTENVDYSGYAHRLDELIKQFRPGSKLIVDLACGTGSISVLLDKMGYDVIAVDASADMLSAAQSKDAKNVLWLCQSMQKLDLYGTVDAMVCVLDSVNHVTDETELQAAFDRAALFLEPGGLFIFDVNTIFKHKNILADSTFVYDTDSVYCVWQNETSPDGLTKISLDFFEQDGGAYYRSEETFFERGYEREKLIKMLERSGLAVLGEFDGYTSAPPNYESQRILFVTDKKEK